MLVQERHLPSLQRLRSYRQSLQETEAIWPEVSSELWLGISEPQASIEVDETQTPNEPSRRRRRGEYNIYSDRQLSSPKVTVEVAGAIVTLDVDTGTSMTVIPTYIYKRFLTHVKLQKSRVKVQTYSGEPLTVRGEAYVPIRYGNQTAREKMVVVEVENKPAVLGRNWLSQIRLDRHTLFRVDRPSPRKTLGTDYTRRYSQLFEKGIGTLNGYETRITLRQDAVPKFHRPRPVPYALHSKVDEELDCLGYVCSD